MAKAARILIVEDDPDINSIVNVHLTSCGYVCTQAFSGSEAALILNTATERFDLIVLDLMLPGMSGEEVLDQVRVRTDTPVIVLSARVTAFDKVHLLERGADDYLVKPFDLDELAARVRVQLRKRASSESGGSETDGVLPDATAEADGCAIGRPRVLAYRDWLLDEQARTLTVAGAPVHLTRIEFNILRELMAQPAKAFTKRELFKLAWQEEPVIEEKTINVHMSHIRAKLAAHGAADRIETVWGIGFKLA